MDPTPTKAFLRAKVVARILAMNPLDRRRQEATLVDRLSALPGFDQAETVLLYASAFPEETETAAMLAKALALGKRLALPTVTRRSKTLRLSVVADLSRDLRPGFRGIPEPSPECPLIDPSAVDWVLVPGLAFDESCRRLGRGAGCYDRLLPRLRPDAPRWALILDPQWVAEVPVDGHDQPIDGVADAWRVVTGGRGS